MVSESTHFCLRYETYLQWIGLYKATVGGLKKKIFLINLEILGTTK